MHSWTTARPTLLSWGCDNAVMIEKRYLLGFSGFITALVLVTNWLGTFKLCGGVEYGQCMDTAAGAILTFLPILAVFAISLVTYKMRGDIYRTWFKTARWYVPIAMLLILITPEYGGGLFNPIQKGSVSFVLTT